MTTEDAMKSNSLALRYTLATLAYRGGKAVRGENYFEAETCAGLVGRKKRPAVLEFD
jgi:hypothetical protein